MRKVVFNKYVNVDLNGNTSDHGIAMLQTNYPNEGVLIRFKNESALIEASDGSVQDVPFGRMRFVKEEDVNLWENRKQPDTSLSKTTNTKLYDKVKFGLSRGVLPSTLGLNITQDQFYELTGILALHISKIGWKYYCLWVNECLSTRIVYLERRL